MRPGLGLREAMHDHRVRVLSLPRLPRPRYDRRVDSRLLMSDIERVRVRSAVVVKVQPAWGAPFRGL